MFLCSNAIMRYLSSKYKTPDHWYPSDPQQRAKVDEALDWFHGNLRCGCFFHCVSIKTEGGGVIMYTQGCIEYGVVIQSH